MPSAMLQQHVCYYVVLAAVSALFHANELCHVDEILDPGLLGRIGGVRTFRRVHFSSQIPYQISSESTQHVQSEAKDMEADFSRVGFEQSLWLDRLDSSEDCGVESSYS